MGTLVYIGDLLCSTLKCICGANGNELQVYNWNLQLLNKFIHSCAIISIKMNENGLLLILDEKHNLYLLENEFQLLCKQVIDFEWGYYNSFYYCTKNTLIYELSIHQINIPIKSQIIVNFQANIASILQVNKFILLEMENGDVLADFSVKSCVVSFLHQLYTLNIQQAFKIATAYQLPYLYACLLKYALVYKDHDMALVSCLFLKLFPQAYILLNYDKSTSLEITGNQELTLNSDAETIKHYLESFQFSKSFALSKTNNEFKLLFKQHRQTYLTHLKKEEFIEDYKK